MEDSLSESELKIREIVKNYNYTYIKQWPPRIFVWGWHKMNKVLYKTYTGKDVIDFYNKKANKLEYFKLLDELGISKNRFDKTIIL